MRKNVKALGENAKLHQPGFHPLPGDGDGVGAPYSLQKGPAPEPLDLQKIHANQTEAAPYARALRRSERHTSPRNRVKSDDPIYGMVATQGADLMTHAQKLNAQGASLKSPI